MRGDDLNPHVPAWLYIFTVNDRFPDPQEEVAFLGALAERGDRPYLLLPARDAPPMKNAAAGDGVIICTRRDGLLWKHAHAIVRVVPQRLLATPDSVVALYGESHNRFFVELEALELFAPRKVDELDNAASEALGRGQAYVKRLRPTTSQQRKRPQTSSTAEAPKPTSPRVLNARLPATKKELVVVGLDPTAGHWKDGMSAGKKQMPSVALVVRKDGSVEALDRAVAWHVSNGEFWKRVADVGATVVAIDGPCDSNGLRLRDDWSGWDASVVGGVRDAERLLTAEGVGLFWTTHATVTGFDGASRWIARSLKLFAEGRARSAAELIETHPHGAFCFLNRAAGGERLEPKTKPAGRQRRIELLRQFIGSMQPEHLSNHDAVDAACAAIVAAFHQAGQTTPFGTAAGGGQIWMPTLDSRGQPHLTYHDAHV